MNIGALTTVASLPAPGSTHTPHPWPYPWLSRRRRSVPHSCRTSFRAEFLLEPALKGSDGVADFAAPLARGIEVGAVDNPPPVEVAAVPCPDAEVAAFRAEAVGDDLRRSFTRLAERACAGDSPPLARARTRTRY